MRCVLLVMVFVSFSSLSWAQVSNPVRFHKHVPEHCGLTVVENLGDLAFGTSYENRTTTLKLVSNRKGSRVLLKLNRIHLGELDGKVDESQVYFRLEAPERYEGDISYWQQGVELRPDLFNPDGLVYISARVNIPESQLPAGQLNIYLEWGIECI